MGKTVDSIMEVKQGEFHDMPRLFIANFESRDKVKFQQINDEVKKI